MSAIAQPKNMKDFVVKLITQVCEENDYDVQVFLDVWEAEETQGQIAKLMKPRVKRETLPKDSTRPKRGKTAYLFFCGEERPKVRSKMGEKTPLTEVSKELGVRWKALQASTKKVDKDRIAKYKAEADKDQERYKTEMTTYQPVKSSTAKGAIRGKSAYQIFCAAKRDEIKAELGPGARMADMSVRLGEMWEEIKEDPSRADELQRYMELASESKAQAMEQVAENTTGRAVPIPKAKKTSMGKLTGYNLFCNEHRQAVKVANPDMSAVDTTKELARMWKELNQVDKDAWKQAAHTV